MLPAAPLPRSSAPRTQLLAALAALALAIPLPAQLLHSSDPLPAFEVATIKPNDPKVGFMVDNSGANQTIHTAGNGRWLVAQAFQAHFPAQQVIGLPPWAEAEKGTYWYRIEAKIPDDVFAQMQTLGADERHRQIALMMQSLLADRFKLKVHFETRELPVYDLVVAKGGPKLPPPNVPISPDKLSASNTGGGMVVDPRHGIRARSVTLDGMLSTPWYSLDGRPIVNKTGLTGTYNLTLNYFPDLPRPGGAPPASDSPVPNADADRSIFSVLEDDLGLKLVPSKGPVEVIVIDHIEPPSEN
jgi:bla regulator protein blaR1